MTNPLPNSGAPIMASVRYRDAVIAMPPSHQDYDGRLYRRRDLEGNVRRFGSYDPWLAG